jgi:cytochrome P450
MGLLRRLSMARKNLLSAWSGSDYCSPWFRFRIFRQEYFVCNSPETVRQVFLEEHDNFDRKSPQMRHALEPLLGDGLFVSDGELWKQRRRYCAPAFESDLLPGYVDTMVRSAQEVVEQWRDLPPNSQVDMLNEMARLTARIIGRSIFGDETSDQEAIRVVQGFTRYQQRVEQLDLADSLNLPMLRWLRNPLRDISIRRSAGRVHQVIDEIIDRYRRESHGDKFNLISLLLEGHSGRPGQAGACPLGEQAARNEAIVMFMAGHETTANALSWTWYLLDRYPEALGKLQQELDDVLQGRPPSLQDVDRLPYTRAVFEEAMRLYPPVPLLSRQSRQVANIEGESIKAGTVVLVVPWLLHRNEQLWDEPEAFRPERFMPGRSRPDKFAYIPFSVGHRVCLGKRFGLTEGVVCLAILAQAFSPKLAPEHRVDIECRLTLRPRDGLPMLVQSRNREREN